MIDRLRRLLPTADAVASNRWLRWLGPALHHPFLWRMSRRGVALGAAIGVFFGFLIPIAQIPVSAAVAVALRANVPSAMASTLVTNPITFPPVYYAAWQVGGWLLSEDPAQKGAPSAAPEATPQRDGLAGTWDRITGVGKPLLLGLSIFACGFGLLVYLVVGWVWQWRVYAKRRRRLASGSAACRA
ncbi:DUF2062 domain-containing protein [Sphaerotilus sp.]|uniref:DUF2062 domain-containing protein n=1 Tax=Sphaerotilus sp. TaxID=2093942 RepID=UPI002ACD70A5|nr:DUF2062 domain-containing protein [Sphaerotilus sp.]MDZ7858233.1 DUF2062 domain-containing protein [Sphaerotilus sp.]